MRLAETADAHAVVRGNAVIGIIVGIDHQLAGT
mgnify:CR=1 FL=1